MKTTDIKAYREEQLSIDPICPLCGKEIQRDEATLDHCHVSGLVRRVLHRSCNSSEGRILHWAKRSRATDPVDYLERLLRYWKDDYAENPIHPTHGKPLRRKRKRSKLRRLRKSVSDKPPKEKVLRKKLPSKKRKHARKT